MERLKLALTVAHQALATLEEAQGAPLPARERRDVCILRFVYTFEAVWKAGQRFLLGVHGLDQASPKSCIRAFAALGLLDQAQAEQALAMADDRNLVVHLYNEALAVELERRLAAHVTLLASWLDAMTQPL